jgi:hypothetical protein
MKRFEKIEDIKGVIRNLKSKTDRLLIMKRLEKIEDIKWVIRNLKSKTPKG